MRNMEHLKCWIRVVVIMCVLLNGLGLSHGCVDQEREALLLLKPFFKHLDWPVKAEEISSGCCEWKMVECNATTGRITKLSLYMGARLDQFWYLNTSHFLPFEQLTSLDLSRNSLVGFVENQGSESLWQLSNLEILDLEWNKLNNSILSSLRGLSSLRDLNLALNQLSGTIDMEDLNNLVNLKKLDMSRNREISGFRSFKGDMEVLDLSRNNLNNSVFASLNGLSHLKSLNLSFNQLTGSIHLKELEGLINLEELKIDSNHIEEIANPEGLSNLVNLKKFYMQFNKITGFGSFKGDLEVLDLRANNLNNNVFASLNGFSHLKCLNLSRNQLTGSIHLEELAGLKNLAELELSGNNIEDITGPEDRTTLNKLKVLGLQYLKTNGTTTLQELFNLSTLEELFLDNSSLHHDFLKNHAGPSTSLKVLHLSSCDLKGTLPDRGWCDLKNLEELDLSDNKLEGTLPPCMANLSSLHTLYLTRNHFEIPLKAFANHSSLKVFLADDGNQLIDEAASRPWTPKFQLEVLSLSNCIPKNSNIATSLNFLYHQFNLRHLDLSGSKFGGRFPNWLFENNTRLERAYLVDNSFVGPFQLPSQPNLNMASIDLSHNKLEGQIPSNLSFTFPNLESLNLSENSFEGTIPASLGEQKFLISLDLSNNRLSGELEETQFAKAPMSLLKLSNNILSGHIPTISNLEVLQLDGNNFVGEIPDLSSLGYIEVLDVSHNFLSGKLPRWIVNMSFLTTLCLSNNRFEGSIPPEFCKLYYLGFLDLSGNNLSESLPPCFSELGNLEHVLLRRNKLRGLMTQSFLNMHGLTTLDLGENNFSGKIPNWIGNLSNLGILILRGNQFHGDIPNQLCNLTRLNILDLSSNRLSGCLPSCLSHFSFAMGFHLSQSSQIGVSGTSRNINMIISSKLIGVVEFTSKRNSLNYTGGYILDHMYGIDLSCNRFSGQIPTEFGNLSNLRALNLSHNSLSGSIPASFSKLKQLESLDLSYNDLNGRIPPQLTEVHTLEVFSVAHNNLSGPLPDFKAQFATFTNSSYEGNPLLCGPPLNNNCDKTHFASPTKEESKDEDFMDMTFFWVTFVVTYTVALFGVVIVLYINSSWRHAWFYRIDVCFNTCYYFLVDKFQ